MRVRGSDGERSFLQPAALIKSWRQLQWPAGTPFVCSLRTMNFMSSWKPQNDMIFLPKILPILLGLNLLIKDVCRLLYDLAKLSGEVELRIVWCKLNCLIRCWRVLPLGPMGEKNKTTL